MIQYTNRLMEQGILSTPSLIVGMDISQTSLERAAEVIQHSLSSSSSISESKVSIQLVQGDFFDRSPWKVQHSWGPEYLHLDCYPFDFIFDYTFFCALPPSMRPAWGRRMSTLLRGYRLTLLFPLMNVPEPWQGPPFPVSEQAYRQVLEPHGVVLVDGPRSSPHSVSTRAASEQVGWWNNNDMSVSIASKY
jgi:methyl halide transferase